MNKADSTVVICLIAVVANWLWAVANAVTGHWFFAIAHLALTAASAASFLRMIDSIDAAQQTNAHPQESPDGE